METKVREGEGGKRNQRVNWAEESNLKLRV
jgi:hypothetical protein